MLRSPRKHSSSVWKYWSLVLITWALTLYIIVHYTSAVNTPCEIQLPENSADGCLYPLQYASKCDLRTHFLNELQEYRVRLYAEYDITPMNPIRMLCYTLDHYYNRFMDRWWFFRCDAALRNPFVEAVLWGPGFSNYKDEETLRENIIRVYGSASYFHIINVFLWQPKYLAELVQISNETAVLELHDEAWCISGADCESRLSFIDMINASLVGFAYPSEMIKEEWQQLALRRHMFHIPKTVSAERFYVPPDPHTPPYGSWEEAVASYDKDRDIDVLLIGATHMWIYPIRWKVACMYKSGYFDELPYKFYHQVHPGYKERTTDNFNLSMAELQISQFAALLRRSKIVVTDSSQYHYGIGKYAEIPAAGALVLGDIPDEREEDFNQFVARVDHRMTPDEIVKIIKYWLENPIKRYQRAKLGQLITLQKYTNDHSIDLMTVAYLKYKQNRFGTHFAYPFGDTCKAISPKTMSEYCTTNETTANSQLTVERGWYLPPKECKIDFLEGPITPPL